MLKFQYEKDGELGVIEVAEDDELQLCPECSLPNIATPRCRRCNHRLLGEDNEWIRASDIFQCSCGQFIKRGTDVCPNCGENLVVHVNEDPKFVEYLLCPECGRRNPITEDVCQECGSSLEEVDPSCEDIPQNNEKATTGNSVCVELTNLKTWKIARLTLRPEEYVLVGSEETLSEWLQDCGWVSRLHLALGCSGDKAYLVDLSRNGTFVDKVRVCRGRKVSLNSGMQITLGAPTASSEKAASLRIDY